MRALDRMISILEAVASSHEPVTMTQVANLVGLAQPTTSRLMRDLAEQGLLDRSESQRYSLGARFTAIARAAAERNDLLDIALPEMVALRDLTNETVSLHLRAGDQRVCVAEIQSRQEIRRVVPLGFSLPLHTGATGQVLLAGLTAEERAAYVARIGLQPPEARTLLEHLERIRRDGYALAVDGWVEGLAGLAAPIGDRSATVAALAVSGPSWRWTQEAMLSHVEAVVAAATRIAGRYGPTLRVAG